MLLLEEGIAFDVIGSRQQGLHEDASWPDPAPDVPFDPDHEGYYGNKTRDVCRKLMTAFRQYEHTPDIVLVHLGTNDQQAGDYENTIGKPLRDLITFLRRHNPQVVILLGHLNFNDGEKIFAIREVVEQVAADLDTDISPVRTVHHYRGWIAQPDRVYTDTFDWAHPNLKGQEKMAHNWYAAMQPFLEAYRR
jgi:lysophospholipase L1-like esterase